VARGDDARSLERAVDRLYGLPLDEFTPARNALARELQDADAAARVKKLAKPSRSAGAINRAVRANRREAKGLLTAADKLREAQERLLRSGDRSPVERAVEAERAAVDRLMAAVEKELGREGATTQAMLERARGTLHAVATTPELREEFESGRITKDHTAVGFGVMSAAPRGGAGRAPKRSTRKQDDARRRLKQAEQDVESAERALDRAQADRDEAEKRLAAARAAVGSCQKDLERASRARDKAREALERSRA
jgi:hypothetical protein